MRLRTYWWGCILIPETDGDMMALTRIPREAERKYEEGTVEWITEKQEFNGTANPSTNIKFPMGKALEIGR